MWQAVMSRTGLVLTLALVAGCDEGAPPGMPPGSANPMAEPRSGHTATLLPSGELLIAGGTHGGQAVATVERYTPDSRE
jgi:hypothetical protein